MRENLTQCGTENLDGTTSIPYDWFPGIIPRNVSIGDSVFIDSSYGFAAFRSTAETGMRFGNASAIYDKSTFVTTATGRISVGNYSLLNGTTLICSDEILIGEYVMLAWGSVVSDNYLGSNLSPELRAKLLSECSQNSRRELPFSESKPVRIEDNVWIGFDAIIMPGTTIGRGSIVGSKSVVAQNVPPYSVVAGNPCKIIKTLNPTDANGL